MPDLEHVNIKEKMEQIEKIWSDQMKAMEAQQVNKIKGVSLNLNSNPVVPSYVIENLTRPYLLKPVDYKKIEKRKIQVQEMKNQRLSQIKQSKPVDAGIFLNAKFKEAKLKSVSYEMGRANMKFHAVFNNNHRDDDVVKDYLFPEVRQVKDKSKYRSLQLDLKVMKLSDVEIAGINE